MTQAEKDIMLYNCSWYYSQVTSSFITALSYGLSTVSCLSLILKILDSYRDIIKCYRVFVTTPVWAYQIDFPESIDTSTITIAMRFRVDGILVNIPSYTGPINPSAIAAWFNYQINNNTGIDWPDIYVYSEYVNGTLYVYAYTAVAYTVTVTSSISTYIITSTNITTTPSVISNNWNNITEEQLCLIYKHFEKLYKSRIAPVSSRCCS